MACAGYDCCDSLVGNLPDDVKNGIIMDGNGFIVFFTLCPSAATYIHIIGSGRTVDCFFIF